jgi:hypothetical protein
VFDPFFCLLIFLNITHSTTQGTNRNVTLATAGVTQSLALIQVPILMVIMKLNTVYCSRKDI